MKPRDFAADEYNMVAILLPADFVNPRLEFDAEIEVGRIRNQPDDAPVDITGLLIRDYAQFRNRLAQAFSGFLIGGRW